MSLKTFITTEKQHCGEKKKNHKSSLPSTADVLSTMFQVEMPFGYH